MCFRLFFFSPLDADDDGKMKNTESKSSRFVYVSFLPIWASKLIIDQK